MIDYHILDMLKEFKMTKVEQVKNDIKNNETISQKEIELREIINNNLKKSEDITSKSTRKITSKDTSVNS